MEDHELGTHNDKMCAEISTGVWPICPNRPFIWDIFEKSPHHMSIADDRILQLR